MLYKTLTGLAPNAKSGFVQIKEGACIIGMGVTSASLEPGSRSLIFGSSRWQPPLYSGIDQHYDLEN